MSLWDIFLWKSNLRGMDNCLPPLNLYLIRKTIELKVLTNNIVYIFMLAQIEAERERLKRKSTSQAVFSHITIGVQLAFTIFVFVYGGFLLDEKMKTAPFFLSIGALVGMVLGFVNLIRETNRISTQEASERKKNEENEENSNRWL
jgi:F0F1-type ATP synthase assembly protein I